MATDKAELLRQRKRRDERMAQQNGRANLAIPGRVRIQTVPHPAPLATPATVAHPVDGGIALHIFGGLSPLQHVAALVAGNCPVIVHDGSGAHDVLSAKASTAVAFAAAILDACEDFEHEKMLAAKGPQPTVEPDADLTPQPVSPIITE